MEGDWLILYKHSTKSVHIRYLHDLKTWEWNDMTTIDSAPTRREAQQKREKYLQARKEK